MDFLSCDSVTVMEEDPGEHAPQWGKARLGNVIVWRPLTRTDYAKVMG